MQGVFFALAMAEMLFGMVTVYAQYSSPSQRVEVGVLVRLVLAFVVVMTLVIGGVCYRKKMRLLDPAWNIETKLKYFRKAYLIKMGVWMGAGLVSLLGYMFCWGPLWIIPWIFILFIMGRNYPYPLLMSQEMDLNEEERTWMRT